MILNFSKHLFVGILGNADSLINKLYEFKTRIKLYSPL